jgi:hypothetical protein
MAKPGVRVRQTDHFVNGQGAEKAAREAATAAKVARRSPLGGQAFADLNPPQKDELLRILAIEAGIIEE